MTADKTLVEFRAGYLNWDGKKVTPDARRGKLMLVEGGEDSLQHVQWYTKIHSTGPAGPLSFLSY